MLLLLQGVIVLAVGWANPQQPEWLASKLDIVSDPHHLHIYINDKPFGKTPSLQVSLFAGKHKVHFLHPCFEPEVRWVELKAGQTSRLFVKPRNKLVLSDVMVRDQQDKMVEAEVRADGKLLGGIPGKLPIPICSQILEITPKAPQQYAIKSFQYVLSQPLTSKLTILYPSRKEDRFTQIGLFWGMSYRLSNHRLEGGEWRLKNGPLQLTSFSTPSTPNEVTELTVPASEVFREAQFSSLALSAGFHWQRWMFSRVDFSLGGSQEGFQFTPEEVPVSLISVESPVVTQVTIGQGLILPWSYVQPWLSVGLSLTHYRLEFSDVVDNTSGVEQEDGDLEVEDRHPLLVLSGHRINLSAGARWFFRPSNKRQWIQGLEFSGALGSSDECTSRMFQIGFVFAL